MIVATQRKILSDLISSVDGYMHEGAVNVNYETVLVGGTTEVIDYIGTPVIWNNTNTRFEVYVAQDIAAAIATGGSPLPTGAVIGLLVGDYRGVGYNNDDADLSEGTVYSTVLYHGSANVLETGIDWGAAAAPAQAAFRTQLIAQSIRVDTPASTVTPTYQDGTV